MDVKYKKILDGVKLNNLKKINFEETFVSKGSDVDKLGNEDVLKLGYDVKFEEHSFFIRETQNQKRQIMTSIEWLIEKVRTIPHNHYDWENILQEAKEMHKQEIIDAVNSENRRCTNISNQSIKMLGFMESDLFRYDEKMGKDYYQETFVSGMSEKPNNHIEPQLPQQEISDEEIEKASWKYEVRNKFDASFIREAFIKGCEWYREQLKQL